MTTYIARFFIAVGFILSSVLCTTAQEAVKKPLPEGSDEKVRQTSIEFPDKETHAPISVFESVLNKEGGIANRYYLSPLCHLIPIDDKGTMSTRIEMNKEVRYTFAIQYYHDRMFEQANSVLSRW